MAGNKVHHPPLAPWHFVNPKTGFERSVRELCEVIDWYKRENKRLQRELNALKQEVNQSGNTVLFQPEVFKDLIS